MRTLDTRAIVMIVQHLKNLMDERRDDLMDLDRAIGDGDLGLTMTKAFAAANDDASVFDEPLPGKLLMRLGMTMAQAAPSTMGTLLGTGFMRGGKAISDRSTIDTNDMAVFFRAFADGIIERGKAKPGEKTVVDSLMPAAESLEQSAATGEDLAVALKVAAQAADDGREAARGMMARHGKAAVFRKETIGIEDPGAYVGALILQGFSEAIGRGDLAIEMEASPLPSVPRE